MKVADLLVNSGKYLVGTIVTGAIGASAGYNYAILSGTNTLLTTQAFAAASIATYIFRQLVEIGFEDNKTGVRNFIHIVGYTMGGISASLIFNQLEILTPVRSKLFRNAVILINVIALLAHPFGIYLFTKGDSY